MTRQLSPAPTSALLLAVVTASSALAGACRHQSSERVTPGASATARAASSVLAPAATLPSAAPSAAHPAHPAEQVVMRWSSALDRHAPDDLAPLYAPSVLFYGQRKTASQVVEAKHSALLKAPDFRQRISDLHIEQAPGGFVATFEKRSGPKLASLVTGRLLLETTGDRLLISEESDAVTDEKVKQRAATTCSNVAFEILGKQAVIQRDMERVAREFPDVNAGGLTYVEGPGYLEAAQGYFHPDHFEPRWFISAGRGKLSIRDNLSDEDLPLSAEQQARVQKLCTGAAPQAGN